MTIINNIKIEPCDTGYMLTADIVDEVKSITNKNGIFTDTAHLEARKILLSVIENFNKANPDIFIPVNKEIKNPGVIHD